MFSADEYRTTIAVLRAHSCEELAEGFVDFQRQAERRAEASSGQAAIEQKPLAWVCYHHDMCLRIEAIFAEEIDALRYAVGGGYLKVAPVGIGEIGNLT